MHLDILYAKLLIQSLTDEPEETINLANDILSQNENDILSQKNDEHPAILDIGKAAEVK